MSSEFDLKLGVIETGLRLARGDKLREGPRRQEYAALAVDSLASDLTQKIQHERASMLESKGYVPRLSEEHTRRLGQLLRYVTRWNQPLSPTLLTATLEALGAGEETMTVKNWDAFIEASKLDGEADARGQSLSQLGLAKATGVDRRTISRWRTDPLYQTRRKIAAMAPTVYQKWRASG